MKSLIPSLLVVALVLCACNRKEALEVISERSDFGEFCFSVDTVRINISEKEKFLYPKFGTILHKDSLYLIGYNEHLHGFDLFNLDGERFVRRITLNRDGPNGIPDVIGFTPNSIDNIHILGSNQLVQINNEGSITNKLVINNKGTSITNHRPDKTKFWLDYNQSLYFDSSKYSVYGRSYSYEYGQCDPQRYQAESVIARVDLKREKWYPIPVSYPNNMSSQSYGFMNRVHTEWTPKELIYGFEFDPNIYVYNRQTGRTQVYDGSSEYTNNSVATMSWTDCADESKKMQHYNREVNFGTVLKDTFRGLHYRFHKKEIPNSQLPLSRWDSKELYLSIFDKEYAKVGEVMPYGRSPLYRISFVGPKGLYSAAPENSNETLVFYIIQIEPLINSSESKSQI